MSESWAKLLQGALSGEPEKVPAGWKTAGQIAEEIGKSIWHTHHLIAARLKNGAIERREFRITTQSGRTLSVAHYRKI